MHGFSGMNSNMKVKVAAVTSQNATDHISLLCFQPQLIYNTKMWELYNYYYLMANSIENLYQ